MAAAMRIETAISFTRQERSDAGRKMGDSPRLQNKITLLHSCTAHDQASEMGTHSSRTGNQSGATALTGGEGAAVPPSSTPDVVMLAAPAPTPSIRLAAAGKFCAACRPERMSVQRSLLTPLLSAASPG